MKIQDVRLIPLLIFLLLSACSPSTRITGSWVDPAARTRPVDNRSVFLASLTRNIELRTKLESSLAAAAATRNIKTVRSVDTFNPEFYAQLPAKEQLLSKIQGTGVTSILTISLIKQESEQRYVRGTTTYMPYRTFGWYGGFYSYYNNMYANMYDPGYYVTDKTYFMESNLYDAKTEKLIWSAQSQTVNPGSIDAFVKEYPKVLMAQMIKDGLLKP
jgi:hypothetical protein